MRGLNAPRGLAISPDGALYVAESGTTQVNGPCAPTAPCGENCWSYVTDAGGNSLLRVDASGAISLVATFARLPAPPAFGGSTQAVQTNVRRGPDGALYVSTLTGVPFTTGAASIFRVAEGGTPQPFATGFKTITDLAFGPDGSLYVLQYASGPGLFFAGAGKVVRVALGGQRTDVVTGLTNPTGIVVPDDGTIHVSNRGNVAGFGEVLRIVL